MENPEARCRGGAVRGKAAIRIGAMAQGRGQYIPNPATWLHQRRWEDEPVQPPANSPSASADRASRYGGVDPFAGAI